MGVQFAQRGRDSGLGGGEWAGRTWPAAPVSDGVPGGGGQGQPPHHAVRLPFFSQMARRDGREQRIHGKKTCSPDLTEQDQNNQAPTFTSPGKLSFCQAWGVTVGT